MTDLGLYLRFCLLLFCLCNHPTRLFLLLPSVSFIEINDMGVDRSTASRTEHKKVSICLLSHHHIKHHHQHKAYGETDGAEVAVLAA